MKEKLRKGPFFDRFILLNDFAEDNSSFSSTYAGFGTLSQWPCLFGRVTRVSFGVSQGASGKERAICPGDRDAPALRHRRPGRNGQLPE